MTTKNDIPRLAASLGVLGTELEQKGKTAWTVLEGWEQGPRRAPRDESTDPDDSVVDVAAEERSQQLAEARRAARHHALYREDLDIIDAAAQRIFKRLDMACPPDVSELRNRRTGEIEYTETSADVAAAGFCSSCWRNDQQMVAREKDKRSGLFCHPSLCRWCMDVERVYGVEPPLAVLKLHHEGRRISVAAMEQAIAASRAARKAKSKKRRKGKAA